MKAHNKKRNAALVFEFLVRKIAGSIIDDDHDASKLAVKLLKKHFRPGTELYKEFRLFNSLLKTTTASQAVAGSILAEAKAAARSIDGEALDREKSFLIREINHGLNASGEFYSVQVPDYRMYATIGTLFSGWRDRTCPDIGQVVSYENKLVEWLMSSKAPTKQIDDMVDGSIDRLVVKLMSEKLADKYGGKLSQEQRELLGLYAFSSTEQTPQLLGRINEIRTSTLAKLDGYLGSIDNEAYARRALTEVRDSVLTRDITSVDDATVSTYMKVLQLSDELQRD